MEKPIGPAIMSIVALIMAFSSRIHCILLGDNSFIVMALNLLSNALR